MLGHILCVAIWLAAARGLYRDGVELARPNVTPGRVDWVGIIGESLSFLIFFEGLQLFIRSMVTHKKPAWNAGRVYIVACALYMSGYFAANAAGIVVSNKVNGQVSYNGTRKSHAVIDDLRVAGQTIGHN